MVSTAGDLIKQHSLSACIRCGKCDSVCPSGRNGGIHPDSVVFTILDADPLSSLSELQTDVWKCLMCHRCASVCPENIDITGAIRSLRYDSVSSGEPPRRFKMASDTLTEHGRAFPVNDIVNQRRAELGLKAIEEDERSLNELKIIISRTGFRNE